MRDHPLARLLRAPEGLIGLAALAAFALAALLAPALVGPDPLAIVGKPLLGPGVDPGLPLGADRLGRDILAGLIYGARTTMATALATMATALVAGAAAGVVAGYAGRWIDETIMRLADAFQSVPSFMLALAIVSVAGPSRTAIVGALAAAAWTGPARVVRAEVMALKSRPFVEASRLAGRHPMAIAFDVILPNAAAPLMALAAIIVAGAVIAESALAFLGLTDPNVPSWGAMIAEGRSVLRTAPHVILAPGLALVAVVLAVSLVGEGLSKALAASDS